MKSDNEKVALITGGTGFIGSHLAKRLINEGWKVHLIIRKKSKLTSIKDIINKLILHEYDGTMDKMLLIFQTSKPAVVFHLASHFIAEHKSEQIDNMINSNVLFGTQLLEAMVANEAYYLMNTGTSWQHYNNKDYSPVCLYAATKEAFEKIINFYLETTPLKVITLKLFDTYGPNDPRQKLFYLLNKHIKSNESLNMSPGEQMIDLVYIDDVINAFLIGSNYIMSTKKKYESFGISSGHPISLKDLVNLYMRINNASIRINWGGRPYRDREVMVPWKNFSKLPGWFPKVDLMTGLYRTRISKADISFPVHNDFNYHLKGEER